MVDHFDDFIILENFFVNHGIDRDKGETGGVSARAYEHGVGARFNGPKSS